MSSRVSRASKAPSKAPSRASRRHNQDEDLSEVSGDDFEQEDLSEQPRFKYSTSELNDTSVRNTRCCLITVFIICIILAIVLSIVLKKVSEKKSNNNSAASSQNLNSTFSGPPTQAPGPGTDMFKSSSSVVDSACSLSNFQNDKTACQSTCTGFSCCNPWLQNNQSCFDHNQQGCINYARCHVLDSIVDPPPDNLADICSPSAIAADRTQCEQKCLGVECCYLGQSSCVVSNFYACIDYAPCQNLRSDLRVPIPDQTRLENLCMSSKTTQTQACQNACLPGSCCWATNPSDNCFKSDFFTCLFYGPCGQLVIPPAGKAVPKPKQPIGDVCTSKNINQGGYSACTSACAFGQCCIDTGSTSCFPTDPLGCLQYDACKISG